MTKADANQYIEKNRIAQEKKPFFHVTPPVGWMNDPNGFSIFDRKVHLFYQYHPYSMEWGPMHWGHVVSEDFVTWKELPVALAPDAKQDEKGCFSGTAMEYKGQHVIIYTGVSEIETDSGNVEVRQNQCMAIGNGEQYQKVSGAPAIDGESLPQNCSRIDFRDPKIWLADDGMFYVIAGNKTMENKPQLILFQSTNLKDWDFVSVLAEDETGEFGTMWECPDYFTYQDKDILVMSPQELQASEEFHNGHNVACFIGTIRENKFRAEQVVSLDYGFDFYAPQSLLSADGRRIIIGWMQSWDSCGAIPKELGFAGMMTLPREFTLADGKVMQKPVREIEQYRKNEIILDQAIQGRSCLDVIKGRVMDLTISLSESDWAKDFSIDLACDEKHKVTFSYSGSKHMLTCDRTNAGWNRDINCIRSVKIKNTSGIQNLRFIMDKYSIELFVNNGEQVFTTTLYTPLTADGIVIECEEKIHFHIEKYDLIV